MESTDSRFKRFIFIIIDGAPYAIFKGLLENGDLPNIKKHVVDRGSLNKAVSVFPSTTGPAFIPFFMGLYPGTANIPGIRWLSKSDFHPPHRFKRPGVCSYMGIDGLRFEADLPIGFPTLFNFFSPVSNIYNLLTRGCPPAKTAHAGLNPSSILMLISRIVGDSLTRLPPNNYTKLLKQAINSSCAFSRQSIPFHTN